MYSKNQIINILESCFQNMNCFSWIKLMSVLIHLKYWYFNFPYLELSYLSSPFLSNSNFALANWNPSSTQSSLLSYWFSYFVLTHLTTYHYKYWIYQTIWQTKPIKFIIKLYTDHNNLRVTHATYQKAESLRADFLSKLDNKVNNNSISNTKYA